MPQLPNLERRIDRDLTSAGADDHQIVGRHLAGQPLEHPLELAGALDGGIEGRQIGYDPLVGRQIQHLARLGRVDRTEDRRVDGIGNLLDPASGEQRRLLDDCACMVAQHHHRDIVHVPVVALVSELGVRKADVHGLELRTREASLLPVVAAVKKVAAAR
ncbi:hypothetical protein D3C80_792510 [compost metagenome]